MSSPINSQSPTYLSAVAAIPELSQLKQDDSVKIATPDLILSNDEVMQIEIMTDLIFEDIGGYELATISRHDLVNGQNIIYTPIKNLTDLYLQYNPNNVLRLQSSDSYFKSLSLSIFDHLPVCGTGYTLVGTDPDLTKRTKVPNCRSVYIDPITGDLVINFINLKENEQVEVEILTAGNIFDDTIYYGSSQ
jgi:hypothetical protein